MRFRTGLAAASATVVAVTLVTMPVSAEPDEPGTPITGQEYKDSPWQREAAKLPDSGRSLSAAASMLSVTPKVALEPCNDDPEWLCGTIPVPIDRSRPHGRTLDLAFMVLPHSDPSSTVKDGLFASDGGPGSSNTFAGHRNFLRFLLRDLTDKRDLVVVDHRGTGQSGAINCPQLQRIVSDFDAEPSSVIRAIGRCGRSLGPDADRYGSGDIAKDMDAVRRALGYQKISIYGLSYAGTFLSAYASRFSDHVRALAIDAGTPSTDPGHAWTWGYDIPPAMADVVGLECMRAPACAAAQPRADSALARLAAALRRQPVSGTVNVSGVGRRHVVANEFNLITSAGDVLNQAELAAVEQARERGDTAPLLRMIGENELAAFEPAPPSEDSAGDNAAAFCNDQDFVWNRSDPVPLRRTKYQAALHALGPNAFKPFSPRAWTQHFLSNYCVQWPAPDRFTPAVPKGAVVTGVPTLILSGDLDTVVPTGITDELLRLFPEATFLRVAGAAHPSAGWSECADVLMMGFLRTLHTSGDCEEPAFVASATSQFPKYARTTAPAEPGAGDQSTNLDRKVVTAAVLAVRDAWLRSFRVPGALGSVIGLRGGSADFDYQSIPGGAVIELHGVRFTRDVAVSGSTDLMFEPNDMTMQLSVDGPRQVDGSLDVTGKLGFGSPFADFVVTGTVHGHHVHLTVPAN